MPDLFGVRTALHAGALPPPMALNIDVQTARAFREQVLKDPSAARKEKAVEGAWSFRERTPQFTAEVEYAKGRANLACEMPAFAGGWGTSPDPIQYCLYGMAACYATTFAMAAAQEGVALTSLRVRAENQLDLRKQMGLTRDPIVQRVKFTVRAQGAPPEVLARLKELADERCPAVECLQRAVPYETTLG